MTCKRTAVTTALRAIKQDFKGCFPKIVVNSDEAAKIYENFQTARGNAYEMTNPEEQELRVVIAGEEQSFEVKNGVVTELKPQPVVQAGEDAK